MPCHSKTITRNAFRGTSYQLNILNATISLMENSLVSSKKTLLPFQKGIIFTSKSLISLFNELKTRYNICYIITRRLNQDVLNIFFGIIRQMNRLRCDRPSGLLLFVPALLLSILSYSCLSSSVSLSYFVLAVPMRECLENTRA